MELKIPKLRQGSYFPEVLGPRRAVEQALIAVIQEAYVHGISARSVDDLVKAIGMIGVSKSQVSPLVRRARRTRGRVPEPTHRRRLAAPVDQRHLREDARGRRIVSVAVMVGVGVNTEGQREALGLKVGASEAEPFWTKFLSCLNRRLACRAALCEVEAQLRTTWLATLDDPPPLRSASRAPRLLA